MIEGSSRLKALQQSELINDQNTTPPTRNYHTRSSPRPGMGSGSLLRTDRQARHAEDGAAVDADRTAAIVCTWCRTPSPSRLRLVIDLRPTGFGPYVYRSRILFGDEIDILAGRSPGQHILPLPMRCAPATPEGLTSLIDKAIHDMKGADHRGTTH